MCICVSALIFVLAATAALLAITMLVRSAPKGSTNVLVLLLATVALAQSNHRIPPPPPLAPLALPPPRLRLHSHTQNSESARG